MRKELIFMPFCFFFKKLGTIGGKSAQRAGSQRTGQGMGGSHFN